MFLSIIVPVYNVEKYLAECLDSLLEQNLPKSDYEIICVNDGSQDGSGMILTAYAEKFPNIRVANKENGGLSSARNAGIDIAAGDYIWFVDADDFVQPNVFKEMKIQVEKTGCDRLMFEEVYVFRDTLTEEENAKRVDGTLQANARYGDGVAWSCLLRRELFKTYNLRFSNVVACYGEDALFNYELNMHKYSKAYLWRLVYYYRRRNGSITTSFSKEAALKRIINGLEGASIMRQYYLDQKQGMPNRNDISVAATLCMMFLRHAMYALARMPRKEADIYLKKFKERNLFPFSILRESTTTSSRMTSRTDLVGKTYDYLCLHSTTWVGYNFLRIWYRVSALKNGEKSQY